MAEGNDWAVVKHITFDLKLCGLIPAKFKEEIVGLFDFHTPYCPTS